MVSEKWFRNERAFDMEAGNNARRVAARANATPFPMPWADMIAQLSAADEASEATPPSLPRTGSELAGGMSCLLYTSDAADDTPC
eukprot:9469220-Pyramimonas_sp.AAC.1